MSYLDDVGNDIRRRVPPELLPDGDLDLLFRLYALLALAKGNDIDAADVHDAWAVWIQQHDPDHAALKPFDALSPDARVADQPFVEAIRAVAASVGRGCQSPTSWR